MSWYTDIEAMASCCGIDEIEGLGPPTELLEGVYKRAKHGLGRFQAMYAFTDVVSPNGKAWGRNFAAYLRRHKLGKVVRSPIVQSTSTQNKICGWFWAVDFKALAKYYSKRNLETKGIRPYVSV